MPGFKPAARSGKAGAKTRGAAKLHGAGNCGTGKGGFKPGNTCGHKANRNATVEAARVAHSKAKAEVVAHLKALRKAGRAAAKAGDPRPAPKGLHAAVSRAAKAHAALQEARTAHRENKRVERNAARREVHAVKSGKAQPLTAKPAPDTPKDRYPGLPPRTADTMSDAIAIASPNGRMSKAAKDRATERLGEKLFGPDGLKPPRTPQPPPVVARTREEIDAMKAQARAHNKQLRENNRKGQASPGETLRQRAQRQADSKIVAAPAHTGLGVSQARPAPTDKGARNGRLALASHRHAARAESLRTQASTHRRRAEEAQAAANYGSHKRIDSPRANDHNATADRLSARARIHHETSRKLAEAVHDPAKSAAAARTLKSLADLPRGGAAVSERVRLLEKRLTHAELKAAAEKAGVDHGETTKAGLVEHLRANVGKAKGPENNSTNSDNKLVDSNTGSVIIRSSEGGKPGNTRGHEMTSTRAEKLTKAQMHAWDEIRHATPQELHSLGEVSGRSEWNDGHIHTGQQNTGTIEALARKGHIEIVKVGGWAHDVVRPIRDLGERTATVELQPRNDYQARDRVRIRPSHGGSTDVVRNGIKVHEVADVLTRAGWKVAAK